MNNKNNIKIFITNKLDKSKVTEEILKLIKEDMKQKGIKYYE